MRSSTAEIWWAVHAERRRLVADLSGLGRDRWDSPSLCPGWDVHDVLAHLVDTARTGRLRFVRSLAAARMDFALANESGIERERRADPRDTLAAPRGAANLTRTPPARRAWWRRSSMARTSGAPAGTPTPPHCPGDDTETD